ncbi:MAG: DUF4160 domain-containing protein [Cycloclasticus sp.]|nr:DUF4160 domain-containing protein [Cycloclasticus sp.]
MYCIRRSSSKITQVNKRFTKKEGQFNFKAQHNLPHIHVKYSGDEVVVSTADSNVLDGGIPSTKMKLLQAWIEIHKEELMADWELAVSGEQPYKIDPLK